MKYAMKYREHKKLIKRIREINKGLAKDANLVRFYVSEFSWDWSPFDDNSGGYVHSNIKIVDKLTGSKGYFMTDNFDSNSLPLHVNDFIIRCSSGREGHWPPLNWYALDIKRAVSLDREIDKPVDNMTWNYVSFVKDI